MGYRSGIALPLIMISLGAVLLISNLGYLPAIHWSDLVEYWPILLVIVGLDILVSHIRSKHLALLIGILEIAIVIGFIFFLFVNDISIRVF